jgi:hypothetical protein
MLLNPGTSSADLARSGTGLADLPLAVGSSGLIDRVAAVAAQTTDGANYQVAAPSGDWPGSPAQCLYMTVRDSRD